MATSSLARSAWRAGLRRRKTYQRKEWLQNRKILKDIINDAKTGLGKTSQQAFSDMTDMYHSRENLLSKAKIEVKLKQSKFVKFLKSPTGKAIEVATGGVGALELGKKIFTGKY